MHDVVLWTRAQCWSCNRTRLAFHLCTENPTRLFQVRRGQGIPAFSILIEFVSIVACSQTAQYAMQDKKTGTSGGDAGTEKRESLSFWHRPQCQELSM